MPKTETNFAAVLRNGRGIPNKSAESDFGLRISFGFRASDFGFRDISPRQNGSILVGLLWCLAILSVVVVGVLHTARMDLVVVKNYGDRIQAHYLALAGVEKARALLYRDAQDRSRTRKNHTGNYYDDAQEFRDVPFSRGTFSVIRRGHSDEGGGIIYGVSDEESRLKVTTATADELANLQNMTPDVATAIVNWRGGDN